MGRNQDLAQELESVTLVEKEKERKQKAKRHKVPVGLEPVSGDQSWVSQERLCFSFLSGRLHSRPCLQLPGSRLVSVL